MYRTGQVIRPSCAVQLRAPLRRAAAAQAEGSLANSVCNVRWTSAARVKRDDAIALCQGRHLIAPHVTAQPQPMNQHDGRPIALRLVVKSNAVNVCKHAYSYIVNRKS